MTTLHIAGGQVLTPELPIRRDDVPIDQNASEILEVDEDVSGIPSSMRAADW